MIQGIGNSASTAQASIEAALKAHEAASKRIEAQLARAGDPLASTGAAASGFTQALSDGLRGANAQVQRVDELPEAMVTGKVSDFHEIAAQIKTSELTFKFALEVRNKLIDAYRETMRMNV
ncbi:MAG TPA: flagellar hook-basal body complex protein FliE [Planctomycetota bacterium]|nr:flagellar hook-basal body complex protein FliE [Planctomycetota bacterium]